MSADRHTVTRTANAQSGTKKNAQINCPNILEYFIRLQVLSLGRRRGGRVGVCEAIVGLAIGMSRDREQLAQLPLPRCYNCT